MPFNPVLLVRDALDEAAVADAYKDEGPDFVSDLLTQARPAVERLRQELLQDIDGQNQSLKTPVVKSATLMVKKWSSTTMTNIMLIYQLSV
jgi:hypothetical protein